MARGPYSLHVMTRTPEWRHFHEPDSQPLTSEREYQSHARIFDYRPRREPHPGGVDRAHPSAEMGPGTPRHGSHRHPPPGSQPSTGLPRPCHQPRPGGPLPAAAGRGFPPCVPPSPAAPCFMCFKGAANCAGPLAAQETVKGNGMARHVRLSWQQGDLFVLPAGATPLLQAEEESVLYWVHDGPLLRYLGVEPITATLFTLPLPLPAAGNGASAAAG